MQYLVPVTPAAAPTTIGDRDIPLVERAAVGVTQKAGPTPGTSAPTPRAKIIPPSAVGFSRSRLLAAVAGDTPVVLVVAPPGAGKTTLLADVAQGYPGVVAWCRLEEQDAAADTLLRTVAAAVTLALEGAPRAVASVDELLALLEQPGPVLALLLDDAHLLAGSEAERVLARIVRLLPGRARVVLAARVEPGFLAAGPRFAGLVTDITADDLRFRTWEVEALFREHYVEPLAPEDAAALARHTEGWAAGLSLFHLSTTGTSAEQRRRAVGELWGRSHLLRRYLTSTVLATLPSETADFLVQSCALGVLEGGLCDRLLDRRGSHALLRSLADAQLFTLACDDGLHFRYHAVLQRQLETMLVERLGADEARDWYRRAAQALEDAGHWAHAYRAYARGEDWGAGAQLVQRHGPFATSADDPWLMLAAARRHRGAGRLAAAVAAFSDAEARFDDPRMRQRCRAERRALASWLPGAAAPERPDVDSPWDQLRAALDADPNRLHRYAAGRAEPEWRLVAGIAAALDGCGDDAVAALRDAAEASEVFVSLAARLCLAALSGTAADATALALDSEVAAYPWLARQAHAVAAREDVTRIAELRDECIADGDEWGILLVTALASAPGAWVSETARRDGRLRVLLSRVRSDPVPTGALVVRCFGQFSLQLGGHEVGWAQLRPRARAALRLLCLHAGIPVHEETLIDALWPSVGVSAGKRSLQVAISSIRALLEPGRARGAPTLLQRVGEGYQFTLPDGADADVVTFTGAIARWRRLGPGAPDVAEVLESALGVYVGDLLPEDGPAEWVVEHRERLRADAADAAAALAAHALDHGAPRRAIAACQTALRAEGFHDAAWRLLIDAHREAGDAAAVHHARLGYARALAHLGVTPEVQQQGTEQRARL